MKPSNSPDNESTSIDLALQHLQIEQIVPYESNLSRLQEIADLTATQEESFAEIVKQCASLGAVSSTPNFYFQVTDPAKDAMTDFLNTFIIREEHRTYNQLSKVRTKTGKPPCLMMTLAELKHQGEEKKLCVLSLSSSENKKLTFSRLYLIKIITATHPIPDQLEPKVIYVRYVNEKLSALVKVPYGQEEFSIEVPKHDQYISQKKAIDLIEQYFIDPNNQILKNEAQKAAFKLIEDTGKDYIKSFGINHVELVTEAPPTEQMKQNCCYMLQDMKCVCIKDTEQSVTKFCIKQKVRINNDLLNIIKYIEGCQISNLEMAIASVIELMCIGAREKISHFPVGNTADQYQLRTHSVDSQSPRDPSQGQELHLVEFTDKDLEYQQTQSNTLYIYSVNQKQLQLIVQDKEDLVKTIINVPPKHIGRKNTIDRYLTLPTSEKANKSSILKEAIELLCEHARDYILKYPIGNRVEQDNLVCHTAQVKIWNLFYKFTSEYIAMKTKSPLAPHYFFLDYSSNNIDILLKRVKPSVNTERACAEKKTTDFLIKLWSLYPSVKITGQIGVALDFSEAKALPFKKGGLLLQNNINIEILESCKYCVEKTPPILLLLLAAKNGAILPNDLSPITRHTPFISRLFQPPRPPVMTLTGLPLPDSKGSVDLKRDADEAEQDDLTLAIF